VSENHKFSEEHLTDSDKLSLIEKWMQPGLWSALDGRRKVILQIIGGKKIEPPEWCASWGHLTKWMDEIV